MSIHRGAARALVLTSPPPVPPPMFRRAPRASGFLPSYRALQVFVFLLYVNAAMWIPALEVLRPAQLTVIVAGLLLVVEGMTGRRRLGLVWPESHLILAFVGASFLSCIGALWPKYALETSIDLSKCAVAYFLVALAVDNVKHVKGVLWTMVIGGFFPALGTLWFFMNGWVHEGRAGWLGAFANPNDAAYALVLLIPIAYALGSLSGVGGRLVVGLALLAYAAAIYTTFSRGGLMGFVAVLLVIALRVRSHVMRVAAMGLLVAAGVAVAYYWQRTDGFSSLGTDATLSQRMITLRAGLEMFGDHPLLGVGAGCSVIGFEHYAPGGYLTRKALTVHNTVVQTMAETGLLGAVPFVLLLISALAGAHRLARRSPDAAPEMPVLASGLQASLVGYVVCGLAGAYTLSWFPYILFGLVSAGRRIEASRKPAELSQAA